MQKPWNLRLCKPTLIPKATLKIGIGPSQKPPPRHQQWSIPRRRQQRQQQPRIEVAAASRAIYVFGVGIPLFNHNVGSTHTIKWSLWIIHKLLLAAAYGFILSANFSKWREKLPPRPSFHNYVAVMFVFSVITLFAYGLAEIDAGLNNWLYDLTMLCYHCVINTNAISLVDNAYYFALGILRLSN
ncbi:hypothetical protein JHK86_004393 [Glycine max]|nr:hypothetical protein JHK86_004393 [Glycine max]